MNPMPLRLVWTPDDARELAARAAQFPTEPAAPRRTAGIPWWIYTSAFGLLLGFALYYSAPTP